MKIKVIRAHFNKTTTKIIEFNKNQANVTHIYVRIISVLLLVTQETRICL